MEQFQAVNIEQSILGSFIVDNSLGEKLKDLKENMFTVEYNKLILNFYAEDFCFLRLLNLL